MLSVLPEDEKKEKKKVCSSESKVDEIQPSAQSSPTTFQQGAGEVTVDGEKGTLSDTKSNEDSGNYSGSDESWESSPEAQESSTEGQELSVEVNATTESQESSSVAQETDSKVKKKSSEGQNSDIVSEKNFQGKDEACSDKISESAVQETDSASPELKLESQQTSSETEKFSSEEQESSTGTHEEAKDTECCKESEDEKVNKVQHDQQALSECEEQVAQPQDEAISQQPVFDVVDNDDYLLYLEDILKKIHKMFFKEYEASHGEQEDQKIHKEQIVRQKGAILDLRPLPDLKKIVPAVKKEVLCGVNLVFSGIVPQQVKLKDSKAYLITIGFGATVNDKLILRGEAGTPTTHLVAANRHTEKVNAARKMKSIKVSRTLFFHAIIECQHFALRSATTSLSYPLSIPSIYTTCFMMMTGYGRICFTHE